MINRYEVDIELAIGEDSGQSLLYVGISTIPIPILLSFRVACAENFHGQDCSQFCNESCTCDPGFTGDYCHINIDDCIGVNCSGNGHCEDSVNAFQCICNLGSVGEFCHEIDNCLGVNCSGNGLCLDGDNDYDCACYPGYRGEDCEVNIDDCVGVNCSGNGECMDGVNSFTCECSPGYIGPLCAEGTCVCMGV